MAHARVWSNAVSNDHGLVYKSIKALQPPPFPSTAHVTHRYGGHARVPVRRDVAYQYACADAFPHRTRTNDPAGPLVKHTAYLSSAHNMFSSLATLLLLPMAPLATYFPLSRKSPFFGDLSARAWPHSLGRKGARTRNFLLLCIK